MAVSRQRVRRLHNVVIVDQRSDAEVYLAYCDELVRFATGLVGPSDAPDVVSEAMLRLMSSRVWPQAENRRALMYKAVLYEARMWGRARQRRLTREANASLTRVVEIPELAPEVTAAVFGLSPMQRAVVFLTYWDDLAADDVAVLLGVSSGTVRKQLGRARQRLRKVLQ